MLYDALDALSFDNSFPRELPADPLSSNTRRQVHGACSSRVDPTPVARPVLVAASDEVLALLDLSPAAAESAAFAEVFAGNRRLDGMAPFAACYGGHQFGHWAGQLGDGRAISLGEIVNRRGERWELQLKGAGPTPYSRSGDGRAVLRSSVREFLCSEAMHHLGVPTTRALSLVTTGEAVMRDMLYDGHPRPEPGAIVCRVAPSFIRFGNFEIFSVRGETSVLRTLADYTIEQHFPELGPSSPDVHAAWFAEICRRTADMVVHWMRVGFVHGVMNTDNMSVLGLTIDYGPYGWIDVYDPDWTPNTTDASGRRYRFGQQPHVAFWNLCQLANALLPLVGRAEPLEEALEVYPAAFDSGYEAMMAHKLGLATFDPARDRRLVSDLLALFGRVETDMTIFFRALAGVPSDVDGEVHDDNARIAPLADAWYDATGPTGADRVAWLDWLGRYAARVREQAAPESERRARMHAVNPKYVLRNYLAQLAIDEAEKGDPTLVRELLDVMRRPYDEQPDKARFAARRPEWARHRVGCSMLSCSS